MVNTVGHNNEKLTNILYVLNCVGLIAKKGATENWPAAWVGVDKKNEIQVAWTNVKKWW